MKFLYTLGLVISTLMLSGFAHAKGGGQTVASFIPIEEAQRVRIFDSSRNKTEVDGQIFVCVAGFVGSREGQCILDGDPKAQSQWQPMQSLTIPGYEIVGFAFAYTGSANQYRTLLVYFRKKP